MCEWVNNLIHDAFRELRALLKGQMVKIIYYIVVLTNDNTLHFMPIMLYLLP